MVSVRYIVGASAPAIYKDFVNFYNDGSLYKQIKVDDIHYESKLYEMTLEDFVKYGMEVGDGRVTL